VPISRDEFEEGETRDTIKSRVKNLLQNNSDKAYTVNEIVDHIFGREPINIRSFDEFLKFILRNFIISEVLNELTKEGRVESKAVHTREGVKIYYAWRK